MFVTDQTTIDDDMLTLSSILLKHLNKHTPLKAKRVKNKRLPDWFNPQIIETQWLRGECKQHNQWAEYRKYRNKTRQLIRAAKRKYFSESIYNSKDTKHNYMGTFAHGKW